jgi:hypothetical protein
MPGLEGPTVRGGSFLHYRGDVKNIRYIVLIQREEDNGTRKKRTEVHVECKVLRTGKFRWFASLAVRQRISFFPPVADAAVH